MQPASIDNPKYYWHNAILLIDWVAERYASLLSSPASAFLVTWRSLNEDEQALLVRMLTRKGNLFRQSQLSYAEIKPFELANSGLTALITLDPLLPADTLAEFATVNELVEQVKKAKKADMVQAFTALHNQPVRWSQVFQSDALIQLDCRLVFDEFRLLFFGNLRQTLSDFIFAELGVQQWLPIDPALLCLAFDSRSTLEQAMRAHNLGEAIEQDELSTDWLADVPAQPAWLGWRYRRRLFQLGHKFERRQASAEALACYQASNTPDAHIRQLRVLERLGRYDEAANLCQSMLQHPQNEAELDAAQKVAKRLLKQGYSLINLTSKFEPEVVQLSLPLRPDHLELGVATAYPGDVAYTENGVWQMLFFLTFAEPILAPVQGAFFHPFQRQPMDLYQSDFIERRKDAMQMAWQLLASEGWPEVIADRLQSTDFASVRNMAAPCDPQVALRFARHAPRAMFKRVFERMWFDLRQNRAGFPDLIEFSPQLELLEVKGPGDQLQAHQRAWLKVLSEFLPVKVLRVTFEA